MAMKFSTVKSQFNVQNLVTKMEFHTEKSRFSVKSRIKEPSVLTEAITKSNVITRFTIITRLFNRDRHYNVINDPIVLARYVIVSKFRTTRFHCTFRIWLKQLSQ